MSTLIIDDAVRVAAAELIERARQKPIPWAKLRDLVREDDEPNLRLADRPHGYPRPETLILSSFRCAFSIEEQPAGFVRHLSVSVPTKGKLPSFPAMQMIAELFGFTEFPPTRGRIWVEEFESGHEAVNVVEVEREKEAGHG
jgi:hypothetical protein